MTDQQLMATLVAELHGIRAALEAMAIANAPEPRMVKPLSTYQDFDWSSINALVVAQDKTGPTIVEWGGFQWKRRSRDDYGADIFFTRPNGKGPDGKVRYIRLITFRGDMGKVKPVPEATREAMAEASKTTEKAPAQSGPAWPVAEGTHVHPVTAPAQPTGQAKPVTYKPTGEKLVRATPSPAKRMWPGALVHLVIQSGVAKVGNEAADLLNLSQLSPKDPEDIVIRWLGKYRAALNDGQTPEQALFLADTVIPGRNGGGGNVSR